MNAPFDAAAAEYDREFTHSAIGQMQRAITDDLLDRITRTIKPSQTNFDVLELNCGTGEDACRLAEKGFRVLATDASGGMVAVADKKIRAAGTGHLVQCRVLDFASLGTTPESGFSLIFSNFGGLNCIPPAQLEALGIILEQKLVPGGCFVAVVMSRFCLWESLYFLLKGKPKTAFRRWRSKPTKAALGEQTGVLTWYYGSREMRRRFMSMQLQEIRPVGFWIPPSYLNPFFEKRLNYLQWLFRLEKKCRHAFWAFGADHIAFVFQKM